MTNDDITKLDALFQQHNIKTEEIKPKSFQELLEEAELFKPEYNPTSLKQFFRDLALARLDSIATSRIFKALKRHAKIAVSESKQYYAEARGTGHSSEEDFGRLLCLATLNRHFADGAHLTRVAGDFYIYNGAYWERRTDEQMAYYVNETLLTIPNPDGVNHTSAISQASSLLRAVSARPDDVFSLLKDPLPIINVRNGELWLNHDGTATLHPHKHTSFQLACLDVEYDPYATCPVYDKTTLEIFALSKEPAEMVRHWNEFMGYAIQPLRDIASWWLLKGQGQNGKTKLVETLIKLMGPTAVAVIPIEQLGSDNKFALARLVGKLMVLDEDMNKNAALPDGMLKSLSEAKLMQAEHKGRDAFTFMCRALPVMLSNHLPRSSDFSHGMLRRANIIPFARQFRGAEADPSRFQRIWDHELPGVLNRALQGLQRLRARGGVFAPPADCVRAVDVWSTQANPAKAFLKECLEPAAECRIPWKEVYEKYLEWASEEHLRFKMGRNTVKRELETLGVRFRYMDGYHMITGFGWRRGAQDDDSVDDLV